MSLLIQYLVKLSISLAIVWLFYQFILRKLTFYNSNRLYLLAYTLLSFFIPFINISSFIGNDVESKNEFIQLIPSVYQYTNALENASQCPAPIWSSYDKWDLTAFVLLIGASLLLFRFAFRYFSFLQIRKRSKLISSEGIKIYQVDDSIIPFSFGNAVFINSNLHTEDELGEIVRHEFVHVKQNHTIDIIWGELLCIINWYNPFAWLLKRSIRQNLEFIADNKVVENGIDKKQYQYLLLKVIGNNQYSIATKFNFSSLKKRIAMMNKKKTAKGQVGRFLLLLPVVGVILLSFRKTFTTVTSIKLTPSTTVVNDTLPTSGLNNKGYYISIIDDNGNCTVVVKDKNKKEVKRILLTEWNAKDDHYTNLYGEIDALLPDAEKWLKASNPDIRTVSVKDNIATVTLKNGKTETYTLSLKNDKKAFEQRCGIKEIAIVSDLKEFRVVSDKIGVVEEPLTIADKPALTEVKVTGSLSKTLVADESLKEVVVAGSQVNISKTLSTTAPVEVRNVTNISKTLSTTAPVEVRNVTLANPVEETILEEVDVIVTLKNTATAEDMQAAINKLKEKGYELKFTNKDYNDGVLTNISGTIKAKGSNASFSFTDFYKITIAIVREGDDVNIRIYSNSKKVAL